MSEEYSLYDAKAKLSALVRQVRGGSTFIITVHGEPVAELRPLAKAEPTEVTLTERIEALRARGEIVPSSLPAGAARVFPIGERVEGALARFLEDRD